MSKKKTSDMSFREFIDGEKAHDNAFIDEIESDIINRMLDEGFKEEEIYSMAMPRLYGLYFQVLGEVIENEFSRMSFEVNPELANHNSLEGLTKQLKELLERLEKLNNKKES
jgi:hypothetical protein